MLKIFVPLVIVLIAFSFLLGGAFFSKTVVIEKTNSLRLLPEGKTLTSVIKVPAVDDSGEGVVTEIELSVEPGHGRTLINIDNILSLADTQNSIRIALDVAEELTNFDLRTHDYVYQITADASVIDGPSAGGAIAVATIAAFEQKTLREDVMMTGTISPDGKIGPVGQVAKKAQAAKESGATIFLIPKTKGFSTISGFEYQRVVECYEAEGLEVCETKYVEKEVQTAEPGIKIVEISHITEALPYFLKE